MFNRLLTRCIFFLLALPSFAQENNIAIGSWRVHLPYTSLSTLAIGSNSIYTGKGSSVLSFDKNDNSINIESKYTGLNDVLVSEIGYNTLLNTFIVGYESGNLDLIKEGVVTNVNDIVRNTIVGSKKINHILSVNEDVYISGDYGVVLYNLGKREVKESYLTLAANASANAVYAATLTSDMDSIFLATSKGVMAAKINNNNLLDFSNWYTFKASDSIDVLNIVSVCAHNGVVYAAVLNKGVYYLHGTKWRKTSVPISGGGVIKSLTKSGNSILACVDSSVFQITSPFSWTKIFYKENITPIEAYYDTDNSLWIASQQAGLVKYKNAETFTIYPDGPLTNKAFRFGYYNNNLIVLSGGYSSSGFRSFYGDWFSTFENNTTWKVGLFEYPTIPSNFKDFVSATYNSVNSTLYISAYGDGLVAIKPDKTVQVYDENNSPLNKSISLLVGETAVDKDGNLWVPNRSTTIGQKYIHKLSSKGVWESYAPSSAISSTAIDVTIDDFDTKWIRCYSSGTTSGIILFNEKTNKTRTLSTAAGKGGLPDIKVNCITKDKKGTMYVGTNQGIAVSYDPNAMLNSSDDFIKPIFDGFPILYERIVLCIAVDGGNRKWVGTNDGLWLFDADLTKVLLYFNKENSPLLSDFIMDIQINELSGEVFFATQEGVVSYRGTATEGDDKYSDVKVFPNPVKPGYSGLVGISGLATNATVKITDVAGNLVYETKAEGGTAVWNVKDYNGRKAATGVYLIFCATAEGSEKFVSKIAVVE